MRHICHYCHVELLMSSMAAIAGMLDDLVSYMSVIFILDDHNNYVY